MTKPPATGLVKCVSPFSGDQALKGLWVLFVSIFQYLISNQFKIKTAGRLEDSAANQS